MLLPPPPINFVLRYVQKQKLWIHFLRFENTILKHLNNIYRRFNFEYVKVRFIPCISNHLLRLPTTVHLAPVQ